MSHVFLALYSSIRTFISHVFVKRVSVFIGVTSFCCAHVVCIHIDVHVVCVCMILLSQSILICFLVHQNDNNNHMILVMIRSFLLTV
ncbi:MAG: hypothetical protein WCG25_00675 [bacterium]